jgi:hypothetical protein
VNLARTGAVLQVDLRSYISRPPLWFLLLMLALTSFGLSTGQMAIASGDNTVGGDSKLWLTSEFTVGMMFPLIAFLFYVFFVAVLAGMAVPRDDELRVGPLLHATRLTPAEYVWGKFGSVLLAFLGVLAAHLLFQMFFNHLWPHEEAEKIRGPFVLANYLRPALFLTVPCLLFFCGMSFAIGELTRKPILVFVAPVVAFLVTIFFLFEWSPSWLDPRINRLLMWIEPSGYRWINETWIKVDRGVEFYNTNPVGYDWPFLASRLAYLLLGLALVGSSARHFAATLRGDRVGRRRAKAVAPAVEPTSTPAPITRLGMTARVPGFVRTALDVAGFEAKNLAGQAGLYLFVPIIILQVVLNRAFDVGAFDTPVLLTSGVAAVASMNSLTLMLCALLMVYTAESVLRDRTTGLAPVSYATPARTAAMLLGKSLANGIVGVVILLAAMLGSFVVVLFQGNRVGFDVGPFLLVWGLLLVPTLLVWSSYVTALVALTGDRYTTYGIALATLMFTGWKQMRGEMNWLGNWDLWGVLTWTDFGSVTPNESALLMNRAFYLAVMVFLVALTVRVFPRREHDSGNALDRLRPGAMLRTAWRMAPVAVPMIALGVLLHVQVGRGWQGKTAEKREQDYWGRNVNTWKERRTPQIGGADVDVALDPANRHFRVRGWYDLVNAEAEPMSRFPMSVGDHFENIEWTVDGEPFEPEERARLFVFEPAEPIAPGDTLRVGFSHEGRFPRGITKNGGGMSNFVLPAGVVLTSFNTGFLPMPFFESDRGVDEDNRTEPRDWEEGFFEGRTPPAIGSGVRFPVRTTISGPEEYRYHGVGIRTAETVENGTRTVVWESDFPVNFFNVVAGKGDVWEGEGVAIYHHPEHTVNIEDMGRTLEASRKWYSEWFYPYPWKELKLSEFPGIASYAQGFPTNITFSESIGFLTRKTDESDAPFLITAHEAAHQWWGNILMPGEGPGGNILAEGMAHFSTILLFRQVQGDRARAEFCKGIEERYGDRRQVDAEKPLVWTLGEKSTDETVMYDKGGWVFWMLHRRMGEEAGLAGIQAFLREYAGGPDFPVLQDYVRVLREHAPDAAGFDEFVNQWFFDVVVPEYRVENAKAVGKAGDQSWTVTATVRNAGTGRVPVEVAAVAGERYAEGEDAKPWKDARVTVTLGAGESTDVTIPCDFEPERVLVDPDVGVLMLERDKAVATL